MKKRIIVRLAWQVSSIIGNGVNIWQIFNVIEYRALECTEGWDCDLGSGGLEFFFANNGLGRFLGPNWKVFHHGTLCEHFQGVVIAFRSWPGGENGAKIG